MWPFKDKKVIVASTKEEKLLTIEPNPAHKGYALVKYAKGWTVKTTDGKQWLTWGSDPDDDEPDDYFFHHYRTNGMGCFNNFSTVWKDSKGGAIKALDAYLAQVQLNSDEILDCVPL